jgi:hypothetical protein
VAMGLPPAHSERQACHTGTDDQGLGLRQRSRIR